MNGTVGKSEKRVDAFDKVTAGRAIRMTFVTGMRSLQKCCIPRLQTAW